MAEKKRETKPYVKHKRVGRVYTWLSTKIGDPAVNAGIWSVSNEEK